MEGRVVQRGECAPINSKNYMSIKKEAITKAGEPVSCITIILNTMGIILYSLGYGRKMAQ